jgi:hypothetical protein
VIVRVGHLVVLAALGLGAAALVRVDDHGVVVLVAVVVRAVIERAGDLAAPVVMRDVVMVVGVHDLRMLVLVLDVSNDLLVRIGRSH